MPNRAIIAELENLGLSLNKPHTLSAFHAAKAGQGEAPSVVVKDDGDVAVNAPAAEVVVEAPVVEVVVAPESVVEAAPEPVVEAPAKVEEVKPEPEVETPVVDEKVEEAPVEETNDKQQTQSSKKKNKK
jgi:hypothetical protein